MAVVIESDDAEIVWTAVNADVEVDVEGVTKYQHQVSAYFRVLYEGAQVSDSHRTWDVGDQHDNPEGVNAAIDAFAAAKETIKTNIASVIAEYQ